jgi:hypothetical protein
MGRAIERRRGGAGVARLAPAHTGGFAACAEVMVQGGLPRELE